MLGREAKLVPLDDTDEMDSQFLVIALIKVSCVGRARRRTEETLSQAHSSSRVMAVYISQSVTGQLHVRIESAAYAVLKLYRPVHITVDELMQQAPCLHRFTARAYHSVSNYKIF